MLKIHNIFNNCSRLTKEYSPYLKPTEKSIEGLGKNRNISLDFSSTPIKQNKKIIKRNTRTNSFNSLIINQTEGGFYPPCSYLTRINGNKNSKTKMNKGALDYKINHQKKKSYDIKKGIFNINKQTMILKKKSQKKKCKRNFLNSYFINPNNVHISFNTVGNNFQIESQNIKPNSNHNKNNFMNNNKSFNNSEINKSLCNISKIKNNKKNVINYNNNISNEFIILLNSLSEEKQKLILKDFKLYLNIFSKIKNNKNNNDIIINENDLNEIQKTGGILGYILSQNFKFKQKNDQLESKINNITKELNEIKQDKQEIKKELDNKDKIIENMNNKLDIFNNEMNKMKNIIYNLSNKSKKENAISLSNKSIQDDLESISLADNSNINEELYNNVLNKAKKNMKQMKRNKSGKNFQIKNDTNILNFSSKVGNTNFNDEFLKNYDYFSESWRKEADKMLKRRGIKLNNISGK